MSVRNGRNGKHAATVPVPPIAEPWGYLVGQRCWVDRWSNRHYVTPPGTVCRVVRIGERVDALMQAAADGWIGLMWEGID